MDASTTSNLIQILAGIVLTYVIYIVSLYTIRADKLATEQLKSVVGKQEVQIIRGVLSASDVAEGSKDNSWNTTIPFMKNYLPIAPSVNTRGGAQFSYAFWMYVGNPNDAVNRVLFLKGDKKKYRYSRQPYLSGEPQNKQIVRDHAIFCPMFKFGSEPMEFDIRFNTHHDIQESMKIRRVQDEDSLKRHNLSGLFPKTWFHVTIVFEDNVPVDDFERGLLVRCYLNNTMYQMERYSTTLKQNRGNFYLFPESEAINGLQISRLSYFNYALTEEEIRIRVSDRPDPKVVSSSAAEAVKHSFETGVRNHFDEYNI